MENDIKKSSSCIDFEGLKSAIKRLASNPSLKKPRARTLRDLLPVIKSAREAGVPHAEIHRVLCKFGLEMSFGTYQVTLHRTLKRELKKEEKTEAPAVQKLVTPASQKPAVEKKDLGGRPERFNWNELKNMKPEW